MSSFFVLFEEWECAAAAAERVNAALSRQLDACCAGIGPAPPAGDIAEARRLAAEAHRRLLALRSLLHQQRAQVALI